MGELSTSIVAESIPADFSGVVAVHSGDSGVAPVVVARGFADRQARRPIRSSTRFACASAAKTFTALVVLRLVEVGRLTLDTRVGDLVPELTQLHPDVTVRHLLEHTSGAGDYLAEDDDLDIEEYVLPMPVDDADTPASLLPLLDLAPAAEPGNPFQYNNGGYVLLAIAAERAANRDYFDLTQDVFDAARMESSGFYRTDLLPDDTALGYLVSGETNRLNLPVRGNGDGGVFLTARDIVRFWRALEAGALLGPDLVTQMTTPRNQADGDLHYGWGLWLDAHGSQWSMEGMDAGVSFRSTYVPATRTTLTVMSNTTAGAWPVLRSLAGALDAG